MNLTELRELYRTTLQDNVLPWWLKHGCDPEDGALNTCIHDDGSVLSRDRWFWSQFRALWVFSRLCKVWEPREEWRTLADRLFQYLTRHGPLDSGHWPVLLDGRGAILRGYDSLYVDGFAIYGLAAYYRLSGEEHAADLALKTFAAVSRALTHRVTPPAYPYPIPPGYRPHGFAMLFSLACHELATATGEQEPGTFALAQHRRVLEHYLQDEHGLIVEWLDENDAPLSTPDGRVVVPGHGIESLWFQIQIARAEQDRDAEVAAARAMRAHLERGWDERFGGLLLAIDVDGRDDVAWKHATTKLWWPHTEALVATLMAHETLGEAWCLEWHYRVREWAWSHYPDWEHGEWRQKLDRQGQEIRETLVLPVKDPFHLPRALIYCIQILDRLLEQDDDARKTT